MMPQVPVMLAIAAVVFAASCRKAEEVAAPEPAESRTPAESPAPPEDPASPEAKAPTETQESPVPVEETKITIDTEAGPVNAVTKTVDAVEQRIEKASPAAVERFNTWAKKAEAFKSAYHVIALEDELMQYDQAFVGWQQAEVKKHTDDDVINTLGAYLGCMAVNNLEMEWVMVRDKYGIDYGVQHPKHGIIAFPFSSVAKRIEENSSGFVHGVFHTLKHQLRAREDPER